METLKITTNAIPEIASSIHPHAPATVPPGRDSFATTLEKVFKSSEIGSGFNNRLTEIQKRALSGATFTPRDLILLQMQMGRFNMQVELVSKVAESATATLRKIQNG